MPPRTRHEVSKYQGSMFEPLESGRIVPAETFPDDPREKLLGEQPHPVVYGPEGSYVNLAESAHFLKDSLPHLVKETSVWDSTLLQTPGNIAGPYGLDINVTHRLSKRERVLTKTSF